MSVSHADLYNWAKQYFGRRDNGGGFMWAIYRPADYTGSAWCGGTQAAACKVLGISNAPTTHARHIYVPHIVNDAKAAKKWLPRPRPGAGKPGYEVIHGWDGKGVGQDHVTRLIEDDPSKPYIVVWGGNHGDGVTAGARGMFVRTFDRKWTTGYVMHDDLTPTPAQSKPPTTGGTKPPVAPVKVRPVLSTGSTGQAVRNVQRGLLKSFPAYAGQIARSGGADGIYGPGTAAVVREFQRRCGLKADGVVGVQTWAALGRFGIKP